MHLQSPKMPRVVLDEARTFFYMSKLGSLVPAQLPKFVLVGGLNTLLSYLLFAVFIAMGMHYTLATLFPGIITIYLGYKANQKYVFSSESERKFGVPLYYIFFLFIYFINIGIQTLLHWMGFNIDYVNGAIAIGICVFISFNVSQKFFFR